MKLIIELPDEVKDAFDNASNEDINFSYYDYNSVIGKAIKNGIPLPKGHGRLIDADAFVREEECCGFIEDMDIEYFNNATHTIIEADKE